MLYNTDLGKHTGQDVNTNDRYRTSSGERILLSGTFRADVPQPPVPPENRVSFTRPLAESFSLLANQITYL